MTVWVPWRGPTEPTGPAAPGEQPRRRRIVLRIDPAIGQADFHVEGILSPTGIARDGSGELYVASLFGAGVSKVPAGTHKLELFLPRAWPPDVQVSGSTLYATTGALANGTARGARLPGMVRCTR